MVLEKLGFARLVLERHPTNWHFHKVDLGDEHSVTYFARCANGNTAGYLLRVLYDQDVHYCMYFAILSKQDYRPATERDGVGSELVRNAHDEGLNKVAKVRLTLLMKEWDKQESGGERDEDCDSLVSQIDLNELDEEAKKTGFDDFLEELISESRGGQLPSPEKKEDEEDPYMKRQVDRAIRQCQK